MTEEMSKAYDELAKQIEKFMQEYGNPHMTLIADQTGVELLQGVGAVPFELLDEE